MIVTSTDLESPLPTVIEDELKAAVAYESYQLSGGNVDGPVARAGSCESVYVTLDLPELLIRIRWRTGPLPSPRDSLPGVTLVFASTAPTMSSIPAPCRCTGSR